jgi:poly(3-hydroxybutyrate) depolymerase
MNDTRAHINRRNFCTIAGGAVAWLALSTGCRRSWANLQSDGRLRARPHVPGKSSGNSPTGKPIKLGLDRERDAILYVPKSATNSPLPLLMFLHGATQSADDMAWYLDEAPKEAGVAILAPNSPLRPNAAEKIPATISATLSRPLPNFFIGRRIPRQPRSAQV